MYFDSHAHYDDVKFNSDRFELISKLKKIYGVDYIINCGADLDSSGKSIDLANKIDFIFAAVGFHPENINLLNQDNLLALEKLISQNKKIKAIGEIGLDYHYQNQNQNKIQTQNQDKNLNLEQSLSRAKQIYWLIEQIKLADKLNLPVIIHSRDAEQDTFNIIKSYSKTNGVIHCYSGSLETALNYINLGFYIGIGGVVTFKNAKKLIAVVNKIPIEKILIETDCPYLAPEPNRGQRNDSANLKFIVDKISQIKNLSHEQVANITSLNAQKLFFKT